MKMTFMWYLSCVWCVTFVSSFTIIQL